VKVRADIAALIRDGHSDAYIARQLVCHRSTVNRARRALPPTRSRLERLYAEAVPTGRVREYRPERMPVSPQRAADNQARLLAALKGGA
jgi:IS30 family transposase